MVWVIAFGELFFGDLWCVVWGYGGMRTHFSLLNPKGAWAWWHSRMLHALRAQSMCKTRVGHAPYEDKF